MRALTFRTIATQTEHLERDLRPVMDEVTAARSALVEQITQDAPLLQRRAAHRRLRLAYEAGDRVLRAATRAARSRSYRDWARLRSRLSALDTERQVHLMQERDDLSVLPLGTVQALDSGMSGPAIGELQHGGSVEPGTPPRYGLDVDAALTASARPQAGTPAGHPEPAAPLVSVTLPVTTGNRPSPSVPVRRDLVCSEHGELAARG